MISRYFLTQLKHFKYIACTLENFIKSQVIGGLILILFTLIALIWANSSYLFLYKLISEIPIAIQMGDFKLSKSLLYWVNDGLMTFFFLLVGLEVKRELCIGELNSLKKAFLPVAAAFFGMVFPALIFLLVNIHHPENYEGWAIPTATDIAFALGVLSLFRSKIPSSIFALLATIAIVDDIGAVVIISTFYTKGFDLINFSFAILVWIGLWGLNFLRIRSLLPYMTLGGLLWYFFLKAGIHPSIAGVCLAATVPLISQKRFNQEIGFKVFTAKVKNMMSNSLSPLQRLENSLNFPVNYLVIPLFILFNAGISFSNLGIDGCTFAVEILGKFFNPLVLGIALGLLIGKPLGIFLATFILSKLGWSLPKGIFFKHIVFMGFLAGIGFTMAIFISDLAFTSEKLIASAKIGILAGSVLSVVVAAFLSVLFIRRINK